MRVKKIETNYKRKMFWKQDDLDSKDANDITEKNVINIYPEIEYQEIIGFGGAFTQSSGYNFSRQSDENKSQIIKDYFSEAGLNYNMGRLPIGSCDFSPEKYSYSNKEDLSDFSIEKDREYIFPILNGAAEKRKDILFIASPWSPPAFMKNNNMLVLGGKLKEENKNTWAEYIVKYILEYKANNIDINYLTVQNEPNARQIWESCLYTPEEESEFIIKYLYPKFKENNINTKILIWDHNKDNIFKRAKQELSSKEANEIIAGIGYHYYTGDHFENLQLVREKYCDKLLIHTEGCTGYSHFRETDEIQNGEIYGHDILGDLNAGANAYIDWNLLLDKRGGPNHKWNYCNSPIMINKKGEINKNLTYYYIGHFSKYIKRGAKRIGFSRYTDKIEVTAIKNPDNTIAVVLLNRSNESKVFNICINDQQIHDNLDSHAIVTLQITP